MSDLIERLRMHSFMIPAHIIDQREEAADELERFEASVDKLVCLLAERDAEIDKLEAALETISDMVQGEHNLDCAKDVADAALESDDE